MENSRIEELRALAFASIPSAFKRPLVSSSSAEPTTVLDTTRIYKDKEEGELSSDEDMLMIVKVPGSPGHVLVHGTFSLRDNDQGASGDIVTFVSAPIVEMPHFSSHHQDLLPVENSVNHGLSSSIVGSSFSWAPHSVPMDPAFAVSNVARSTIARGSSLSRFPSAASPLVKESPYAADISSYSLASATSIDLSLISSNPSAEISVGNTSKKAGWVLPCINAPSIMSTLCSSFPSDSKKDDAFVIKFSDGDSDSEEEQQHLAHENSLNTSIGPERALRVATALNSNISVSQQNISNSQASALLKEKFVNINTQHMKAKAMHSSNAGKGSRRFRNTVLAQKPIGSSMNRTGKIEQNPQAVSDLEALRLKIAAKESELQQQRQLLAIKEHGPKGGLTTDKSILAASPPTVSISKKLVSCGANNMRSNSSYSTEASSRNLPNQHSNSSAADNTMDTLLQASSGSYLTNMRPFATATSSGESLFVNNVPTKDLEGNMDSIISSTINSQFGGFSNGEAQLLQNDCNLKEFFSKQDASVQFKQPCSREGLSVSESICRSNIATSQKCQHRDSVPSFDEIFQKELSFSPIMGRFEALALENPEIFRSIKRIRNDTYFPRQNSYLDLQVSDSISSKNEKALIDQEMPPLNRLTHPLNECVAHGHGQLLHSPDASEVSDIKMGRLEQSFFTQGIVVPSSSLPSVSDAILLTGKTQELNVASFIESTTCKFHSEDEPLINKRWHEGGSPRDSVKRMKLLLKEDCSPANILPAVSITLVGPIEGPKNTVDICRLEDNDSRGNNKVLLSHTDGLLKSGHHHAVIFENSDTFEDQVFSPNRPLLASHPLEQHFPSTLYKLHTKDNQVLMQTVCDGPLLSQAKSVYDSLQLLLVQLKAEEEVLDQQLEVAQQSRHMCETQERLSWKTYREARDALAKANLECELHYKKRESLYAQMREAQNKHQLAKYFLEAPDAMKLPVSLHGSQSLYLQELPLTESEAVQDNAKQLSAHVTHCNSLNKFQGLDEDKSISKGTGAAMFVPMASTILSSTSFKMDSNNEVLKSHYCSQMLKKDDENIQHLVSQNLTEMEETNLDLKEIVFDDFHQDFHLRECLQPDANVQDDFVKEKPCKSAQKELNEEIAKSDDLVSMRGIMTEVSSKDSKFMVDTTEDTSAVINQAASNSFKASCQSHTGLTSQKLGNNSELNLHHHGNEEIVSAVMEPGYSNNYDLAEKSDNPGSGKTTFQPFLKTNMPILGGLVLQTGLQKEPSKLDMDSLSSFGEGHSQLQATEPVEEYSSLKYERRSCSSKESGFGNVDDPAKVPFLGGPVCIGIRPHTEESTYATSMEQAIILTAATNVAIAPGQNTAGKLKQHVKPVAPRPVKDFSNEKSLSENCQESQAGLQKKDYYAFKQPTNSKEESFSAIQKREGKQISECRVPSADFSLIFSDLSWTGRKQHGMECIVSQRKADVHPETLTNTPILAGYESPLSGFQRLHTCLCLSAEADSSVVSSSLRFAVDPFQPLCKFEHRGKCNDDHCCWQHKNDQTSISKKAASCNSRWKDYVTPVPIYRISNHVMRDDMDAFTSLGCMIQRRYKHQNYQAHFLSLSCQRLIPHDMPCLLEPLKCPTWWDSNCLGSFEMPSGRHSGDDFERRAYIQHVAREPGDVEAWLDLALNLTDYDLHKLDSNSEKDVLFVLSRALEANPTSVSLWMVYLHTYYGHQKGFGHDDMFDHAVKLNSGSYELWLLYIHSRFQLRQRLDSYELAIRAIGSFLEETELKRSYRSCQILDLALQMLHCMCISEQIQDAFSWIDDLCFDASERISSDMNISKRACTRMLLTALHPEDACILWVSCAYVLVCHQLPTDVIRRLGYKQQLLYSLNWMDQRRKQKFSSSNALHLFEVAASNGIGCLDLRLSSSPNENIRLARQSFAVIYVQYLTVVKGPEEAITLGQCFQLQFPKCVELVVLCARIKQQHVDVYAALSVFEEALVKWPNSFPVSMCLWNQYAGHALEWKGKDSAWLVLRKCALYIEEDRKSKNVDPSFGLCVPSNHILKRTVSSQESVSHSEIEVIRGALQSLCYGARISGNHEATPVQETAFALLNLAFFEMLNNNFEAADSVAEKVIELPLDEEFIHFWKEYLSFKFLVTRGSKPLYETLISLFDKCYVRAQHLPKPNPLLKRFLESFKKRRVRGFFENLLIPPPSDSSLFNSILEACFGPGLLPKEQPSFIDWVDFFGGLLEFCPSNIELALSVCRVVFHNSSYSAPLSSVAAAFWAGSMLAYSLIHSHPLAPEGQWVEAGVLLEDLGLEDALQQFYRHAFLSYPFSTSLWRSFIGFNSRYGNRAMAVQAAKDRGLDL